MKKILVIVESPAKCKKIQGFLGPEYIVKASFGHICNIDKKKGLSAIDIANNYTPKYAIISEKMKYIKDLKKYSKNAKEVIIASDLDREGEAIGYHLVNILKLDLDTTKRIVFNEITKSAITNAVNNPLRLNMNLIYAQQARQILDYLIGFDISPVLWKHVKNKISAGRCQSPALKLICEKEQEIQDFSSQTYFNLSGEFKIKNIILPSKSTHIFSLKKNVLKTFNEFKKSIFKIKNVTMSQSKQQPSAPYITSTIQQDASNKLGMSPKNTMSNLQKLYEKGKITYMRTDSKIISDDCINSIKKYILDNYGNEYYKFRKYTNNSKNTQEAHECIRPVNIMIDILDDSFNNYEQKLYSMIWKRTIACQMKDLLKDVMKIKIENNKNQIDFVCLFEKIVFLGFGIIYNYEKVNEIDSIKNIIKIGDKLNIKFIESIESMTNPIPRYTEASLIKDLEKKGIGRPSTFSSIVETLFKREYIKKDSSKGIEKSICNIILKKEISETCKINKIGSYKNKIAPSELGKEVNIFMSEHFTKLLNIEFSSSMENTLDDIANGNSSWVSLVDYVYNIFHPIVKTLSKAKNKKKQIWEKKKDILGINPENNKSIYCYNGKFGPVIQEGDDNPKYTGIPKSIDIQNLDLNTCLELLNLPKDIGKFSNKIISVNTSNYGFYIKYNNNTYSIDDYNISLKDAISIIKEKKTSIIKTLSENITIREGPYGPYILKSIKGKKGKIISIPKNVNPINLTIDDCNKYLKK